MVVLFPAQHVLNSSSGILLAHIDIQICLFISSCLMKQYLEEGVSKHKNIKRWPKRQRSSVVDFCSDKRRTEDQTAQRYLKFAVMMVRMDEHGPEVFLFVSMYVPKNVGRCSLQRFFSRSKEKKLSPKKTSHETQRTRVLVPCG